VKAVERSKDIIIDIINNHLSGCKIYMFGSRARKDNYEGSDIDIAIDHFGKKIEKLTLCKIIDEIEETNIPFCVDVLDFNNISQDIKSEILKDGILWKNK
jgi:uncharacterized protein